MIYSKRLPKEQASKLLLIFGYCEYKKRTEIPEMRVISKFVETISAVFWVLSLRAEYIQIIMSILIAWCYAVHVCDLQGTQCLLSCCCFVLLLLCHCRFVDVELTTSLVALGSGVVLILTTIPFWISQSIAFYWYYKCI